MSDMSSMSRERKKQKLRSQMITPGKDHASSGNWMEGEEAGRVRRKSGRRHLASGLLILILLLTGAGTWFYYQRFHRYTAMRRSAKFRLMRGAWSGMRILAAMY